MKTLNQFLEQAEPAQAEQEPKKEDPKVKQAEKKESMLKRRVLMAKMRAVRQGATGIMASYEPNIEGVIEYFYEEGINEEGFDQLIEEIGLEEFVNFVDDSALALNEERAARRATVRAKKYDVVKKEVDKADAARKKAKKGEYAPSYAKKETDVTVYDDKPAAKKKAPVKKSVVKKAAPKPVAKKPVAKKVVKAVAKVKKTQPVKKPSKQGLGDRIRSAYKAGVKRHRKATQVPRVFAKGAVAGAKKAVKFAKDVKKVVSEEEMKEGIMQMIKRVKKKPEKKAEKAMDAGSRARRKIERRVHAKYVSGSEDNVPDDIREASAVLDANTKIKGKEDRAKKEAELRRLLKHAIDMKKGRAESVELGGEVIEGYAKPKGMENLPKGSKVRVKKGVKVQGKYVNERTLSSYIPSDRQGEARRANLDYVKAQLKKKEDESTKNRGDLSKRDAGKMAKERLRTKKIMSMGEAKVDAGKSPEEKEKVRNVRRFGVSHNVAGHGKLRRALHRSDRGDKKIKGDKSAYVEMEAKKNPNNLVEPRDGVDSAKEVNRATRKAAFRPFNKEEVQVNEANRGEKEVDASDLKKVGRRNINRFETGTVKRTESSGGRRPTYKTVTLANPKAGYGKKSDHYKKNKLSAPSLGRHGTSSETEKGPQKHHTQGVEYHDAAQKQRRQEHKAKRGVKTKGTVAADIKKSLKEGKKKGLWDNIHAKRKRGEKPAKPGDKDYPKTLNVEGIKQARKNVGADKCWDGYKAKGTKKKGGKEVPNCVKEGAAWTKKSGKNPEGGLNEKGRKSYERENPGSDLKAPQPEGGSRKKSFCARMGGMKKKLTSAKTANDPDSRINKSLRKWKCNEEDKAFNYVVAKLKAKHGDGVLTKGDKIKPPTAAQKKAAAAHRAKVDKENAAEFKKDPSQGRYPPRYSNRGSD